MQEVSGSIPLGSTNQSDPRKDVKALGLATAKSAHNRDQTVGRRRPPQRRAEYQAKSAARVSARGRNQYGFAGRRL